VDASLAVVTNDSKKASCGSFSRAQRTDDVSRKLTDDDIRAAIEFAKESSTASCTLLGSLMRMAIPSNLFNGHTETATLGIAAQTRYALGTAARETGNFQRSRCSGAGEPPQHGRIVQRLLGRRIAQVEPLLQKVHPQHGDSRRCSVAGIKPLVFSTRRSGAPGW
jgi:hypothetical protein